jgi:hypothetical protein
MMTINVTLGLITAILSFGFFLVCRYLISPLTYFRLSTKKENDKKMISSPYVRTWFTYVDVERWQRLNLFISWIHALITGVLVLYSFLAYSGLRTDFVKHVNFVTYVTCSFSLGMFDELKCFYGNRIIHRFRLFLL